VNEHDRAFRRLTRRLVPSSSIGSTQEYIGDTQTTPSLLPTPRCKRCTNEMIRRTRPFARCVTVGRSWLAFSPPLEPARYVTSSVINEWRMCIFLPPSLPFSLSLSLFLPFSLSLFFSLLLHLLFPRACRRINRATAGANSKIPSATRNREKRTMIIQVWDAAAWE